MTSLITPLNVLITRPEPKAQQLALLLNTQGITNTSQALFDYQAYANAEAICNALTRAEILIFVSAAAVNYAHANYPLTNTSSQQFFAVGKATKDALMAIGISHVFTPPPNQEHSEGLLNLSELTQVTNKNITIFRGNGGREHIANTLKQRGANINYVESYQRVWRTLPNHVAKQWQAQQINCIVVTSNDILVTLLEYLNNATDNLDDYWQKQCLWVVVSERIEQNAKALGIINVINSHSASSQILCDTLQALSCS